MKFSSFFITRPVFAIVLSLLIVVGGLLLIVGVLGALALRSFKKGTPPVPRQAIEEARLTGEAIKADGRH